MNRMRNLVAVFALLALGVCLATGDDIKSENEAKTVRAPDGKFTQVNPKDNSKAKDKTAEKTPVKEKDAEKTTPKEKTEVISADEVAKLKELDGKQVTVKGKVDEVYVPKSGTVVILNFGKDHKACFKVAIFKANFEKFGGVDAITKSFSGKTVQVEGKVQIYQGQPEIVATVPSQVKAE